MNQILSSNGPATLKKGARTRLGILNATLEVIASQGLRSVTHRAVAARANVQLSLTTYYFKDIHELIQHAFAHFCEQSKPGYQEMWSGVFDYLASYSATELRKTSVREEVCQHLSERACNYLVEQVRDKPVGLAVEQIFFTEVRLSPELRELAASHRQGLLEPLVTLCSFFNKRDPQIDAQLLLDTLSRLEYEALLIPVAELNQDSLLKLVRRQLGWAMGLSRA